MALDDVRMLATLLAIGAGIWAGGLVTVILLVVSSRKIHAPDQVALFRAFGRKFAKFFGITAVFVVVPALVLAWIEASVLAVSTAVLAIVLLIATALGVVQARRMTALRTAFDGGTVSAQAVRRNARVAAVIRALLVTGYVALLVLAVLLAGAHTP